MLFLAILSFEGQSLNFVVDHILVGQIPHVALAWWQDIGQPRLRDIQSLGIDVQNLIGKHEIIESEHGCLVTALLGHKGAYIKDFIISCDILEFKVGIGLLVDVKIKYIFGKPNCLSVLSIEELALLFHQAHIL